MRIEFSGRDANTGYHAAVRFRSAAIGVVAGLAAAGLLMIPARSPFFAATALLAPIAGGAIAAILAARGQGSELDVDEAAAEGGKAGAAGGFVLAVPVPLAMHMFVAPRPNLVAGLSSVAMSILLLLGFVALSVLAAVIAARWSARSATIPPPPEP